MKLLRQITPLVLAASVVAFPVAAQEMDHSTMQPQQHGTTMMHSSSSDEDDMSHTKHGSPSEHMGKDAIQGTGEHHADHDMGSMHHDKKQAKIDVPSPIPREQLTLVPPSGKSREAGYDGSYMMDNTSLHLSLKERCALASRGLIMLDNASWKECGSKPSGLPTEIETSAKSESQHMMHH